LVLFWSGYEVVFHFDGTEAAFKEPVGRSDKHLPLTPQTEQIRVCSRRPTGRYVFAEEPVRPDHSPLRLKNVVVAPQLAWPTLETLQRSIDGAMRNVKKLRAGLPLENRVA
jgi:hypothetical protein